MTDKQLVRFATQFRKGMLGKGPSAGRCFMVCAPLQGMLSADGIKTDLLLVDFRTPSRFTNHAFLRMADGRILDPTADQFPETALPPVYLGEVPYLYYDWCSASFLDSDANQQFFASRNPYTPAIKETP